MSPASRHDVDVEAADDQELDTVLPVLGRVLGTSVTAVWSGSTRLSGSTLLGSAALSHGAVLALHGPAPRSPGTAGDADQPASALELQVTGGPEAGRSVPVPQGRLVLGRGAGCGLSLSDPDVSRQHVVLDVRDGLITVADLGSANGSRLGDEELGAAPRPWAPGETLRVGASAVRLAGPSGGALPVAPAGAGRLLLRPHHRVTSPRVGTEVRFPAEPVQPPPRRLAWVAIALPAVAGVAMAVLLSAPQFLFFALLSPVVALGTWVSDRWSGRRRRRQDVLSHALELRAAQQRLTAALATDLAAARAAHPDAAALTSAARRRSAPLWQRTAADPDALVLRVGSGPGPTLVRRRDGDAGPSGVEAEEQPVTVDLRRAGVLGVVGPVPLLRGMVAALLVQLAGLHSPADARLALLTGPRSAGAWSWCRWLPHLSATAVVCSSPGPAADEDLHRTVTGWVARHRADRGPGGAGWLVVLVDRPLPAATAALLRGAQDAGVVVVCLATDADGLPVPAGAVLAIGGETGSTAELSQHGDSRRTVTALDQVPPGTAARFARSLAPLGTPSGQDDLPAALRLADVLPLPADGTGPGWTRSRTRLVATLGRSSAGVVQLDLCAQGPHALVAGTTGSGKSELLQTLVAGLALAHPPDRCSFLLVDYKGGAAFAETAALPHTVGMVTDLDPQSTARALRSLGAELTRREQVLAEHGVRDLGQLPEHVPLARLVIVVDEFATLAEELPDFVLGLVGIAQRGRSLGVHLVLATQRPAGVVSPEIRANCSLRICLRTTDEADSRDVLGTPVAAHLPVELPGRGHVRSGSGTPTLVQVARVSTRPPGAAATDPVVRERSWPPGTGTPAAPGTPGPAPAGDDARTEDARTEDARTEDAPTDLARLVEALVSAAAAQGIAGAHRPWQPPLPDRLPAEVLAREPDGSPEPSCTRLRLGLVDRPDAQARDLLTLDLDSGGAWLAVGGARSGRSTLLRSVLRTATAALPPSRLQVHVLDHGGGALAAEGAMLPHAGTVVGGDDPLRTLRLVQRLTAEVADRRAGDGRQRPRVLLLVDGAEALGTMLDEIDPATGSAGLHRLVRDGAAAGLTCLLTADRAVPGGRLAAVATRRLVLPLPDRADYAVAGLPARAVPAHRPPGRALIGEEAWECQLALPPVDARPARDAPGTPVPDGVRIPELPAEASLPLGGPGGAGAPLWLPVGLGGDEGTVVGIDLARAGGLLVAGPPGSGRSTTLDGFAAQWAATGVPVLRIGAGPGSAPLVDGVLCLVDPGVAQVQDWVATTAGGPAVVVVDDLAGLPDALGDALTQLCRPGRGLVLVGAGAPAELAATFRGPTAALRRSRSGLLLRPGPGDAEVLGIRLPRARVADRPGSGWLVVGGVPQRVQVARHRLGTLPGPAPQPPVTDDRTADDQATGDRAAEVTGTSAGGGHAWRPAG